MVQFNIINGSLKITNQDSTVILLIAKKDVSVDSLKLYQPIPFVSLYNLNKGYNEIVFYMALSECQDDVGNPFTVSSFIAFAEANLGFDTGGIPQTITVVDKYSDLPDPTTVGGDFYWCENSEGIYLTGIYYSNGVSWETNEAINIIVVANYSALPDPTTVNGQFYWCENSQGTAWLWGSLGGTYYPSGTYYSNGVSWSYIKSPQQATQIEVDAGTNTDKFVTPNTLLNDVKWTTKQDYLYDWQTIKGLYYFNEFEGNIPTTAVLGIIDGRLNKLGNGTSVTFPQAPNSTSVNIGTPLLQSTATNSWTGLGNNVANGIILGNGVYKFEVLIQLSVIADVTNQIVDVFGLTDTVSVNNTTPSSNGCFFVLENLNTLNAPTGSNNWQCITLSGGLKTTTITSIPQALQWIKLSILVNANASSVEYYIDGNLVATHTTNIPTVRMANFVGLNKRSVGTVPMGFYIDYLTYEYKFTTLR